MTPLDMTVLSRVPLSIVTFAPIATLLPILTPPRWVICTHLESSSIALPKPSEPITDPESIVTSLPIITFLWIETLLPKQTLSPRITLLSIKVFFPEIKFDPTLKLLFLLKVERN